VTLLETWGAMESLVDCGKSRAIGLSDISLNELLPIYESARIKPAVAARRSSHFGNCRTSWKDASTSAVGLGGAAWHGSAYNAWDCGPRAGEFQHLRPSGRGA
jgi:hypothetical protein